MADTGPHLFFQIAAALIPALLFAGGMSLRPHRLVALATPGRPRVVLVASVVSLAAAAAVAEFFAIAGALSSSSVTQSAFRIVFVANVIALSTLFVAVGFAIPWIEALRPSLFEPSLWPPAEAARRRVVISVVGAALLVFASIAALLLSHSVSESLETRRQTQLYCIRKGFADNMDRIIAAQERAQRASDRFEAKLLQQAETAADPSLSREEEERALRNIRREAERFRREEKTASDQVARLIELSVPQGAGDLDEYLAAIGCP